MGLWKTQAILIHWIYGTDVILELAHCQNGCKCEKVKRQYRSSLYRIVVAMISDEAENRTMYCRESFLLKKRKKKTLSYLKLNKLALWVFHTHAQQQLNGNISSHDCRLHTVRLHLKLLVTIAIMCCAYPAASCLKSLATAPHVAWNCLLCT